MPNKKTGKKNKKSLTVVSDVTIYDFANSSICANRPKKSNPITVLNTFKEEEKGWEEKGWEEKLDEDNFELEIVESINEEGEIIYSLKEVTIKPTNKEKYIVQHNILSEGIIYPYDIWVILSKYIRPEDIGRFAGICKSSLDVVSSAQYWYGLYKRYYKPVPGLPDHLKPEFLVRKYSLRTYVIRALHFMYNPFIEKLKLLNITVSKEKIIKRECISMWHQQFKNNNNTDCWIYYFKMKEKSNIPNGRTKTVNFLEKLDDVFANREENCRILLVTSQYLIHLPSLLGQTLTSVCLTLSAGFIQHKLQLGFVSGVCRRPGEGANSTNVVLDPVINVKVLDWWHPLYPYSHNIQYLLDQD